MSDKIEENITDVDLTSSFMEMLEKYKISSPEHLESIFQKPILSFNNVQQFLKNCSVSELAYLFYESGLHKIREAEQEKTVTVTGDSSE